MSIKMTNNLRQFFSKTINKKEQMEYDCFCYIEKDIIEHDVDTTISNFDGYSILYFIFNFFITFYLFYYQTLIYRLIFLSKN
jgi:hypothetical protein